MNIYALGNQNSNPLSNMNFGTQFQDPLNTGLIAGSAPGLNPTATGTGLNFGGMNANALGKGNNFGFNIPSLQLGLQGLSALSGLYFGNKALGMAEDQFAFQKDMANKNLNNSVTAYNTGLEDRLRSRAEFAGDTSGSWQSDFERLKATK